MKKPNILFILIDDMGWKDLACTGSSFYETPNLDRLREQGMMFENAYASCPVCSPSRASILTGKYPARLGVTDWIDISGKNHPLRGRLIDAPYIKHLPRGEYTIAQALKDEGYCTWHVGKWHLGTSEYYPEQFGFDQNIGGCFWGSPFEGYFAPYGIETLPEGPDGEYLTDRLTDEALTLLRKHREENAEQPFFLNLCYYAVHTPIEAKEEDIAYFEEKARRLGLDQREALVEGEEFRTEDKKGRHVVRRILQSDPAYAAMVWNLDHNVGRILEELKSGEQDRDTIVVFTSDNGGLATAEGSPTCNAPAAEGKGWMYEGGTRVPLLIRYPAMVKPGSCCDTPVTSTDFYPTFLELAGGKLKEGCAPDGRSIVPLLKGDSIEERPLFWHYPHYGNQGGQPGASVLLGSDKFIEFFDDEKEELYNLNTDLEETKNLISEQPQKAQELRELLHQWQAEVEALFPKPAE